MGTRAGQGYGVPKPKRGRCGACGKKGLKQWSVMPTGMLLRECQYCCDGEVITGDEYQRRLDAKYPRRATS
jgi:hypothetical protein